MVATPARPARILPPPTSGLRLRLSYEEYLAWAPDNLLCEWVDGEAEVYVSATDLHQRLLGLLHQLLAAYVATRGLGVVRLAPSLTKLWPEGPGREPDLFFARAERAGLQGPVEFRGGPDLVVEIVSEDSVTRDRETKLGEYARAGVGEYWLLDPRPGTRRRRPMLTVYRLGAGGHYGPGEVLRSGVVRSGVLPGFWLRVEWLWQEPLPDPLALLGEIMRYPQGPEGPEEPGALAALPYAATLRAAGMRESAQMVLEARWGPLDAQLQGALGRAGAATLAALLSLPPTATLVQARALLDRT